MFIPKPYKIFVTQLGTGFGMIWIQNTLPNINHSVGDIYTNFNQISLGDMSVYTEGDGAGQPTCTVSIPKKQTDICWSYNPWVIRGRLWRWELYLYSVGQRFRFLPFSKLDKI